MICRICSGDTERLFTKKVLGKYGVQYFRCKNCQFTQTEDPYWLDEAYNSAITALDLGLAYRNLYLSPIVQSIIGRYLNRSGKFLDFGGGYGLFVRLMRDAGFDYYRQDKYCQNLFAANFDVEDIKKYSGFEAVSAFEVFEHLVDPITGIEEMLKFSRNIIFSTDLAPSGDLSNWDYLVPEVGQHVSLYSHRSLQVLADKFKLHLCSNGRNVHFLSEKKFNDSWFRFAVHPRIAKFYARNVLRQGSLLPTDYATAKARLQ
jgi:hypothetical protein